MFLGSLCYGYALYGHLVYLAIPGTRPLCMKKKNAFVIFTRVVPLIRVLFAQY